MKPANVIPAEKFIRIWQRSETARSVGRKLGIKSTAASSRATFFRANGVPLKHFRGDGGQGRPPVYDFHKLAALAKSCLNGSK